MRVNAYNIWENYERYDVSRRTARVESVEDPVSAVTAQKEIEDERENGAAVQQDDRQQENSKQLLEGKDAAQVAMKQYMKIDKALIGRDSSLETLDIQKAISGMRKDSILQEYQSFVENLEQEDGTVRKIS